MAPLIFQEKLFKQTEPLLGSGDLLAQINDASSIQINDISRSIGRTTHTGEDNVFAVSRAWATRFLVPEFTIPLVEGEHVRDHFLSTDVEAIFPYDRDTAVVLEDLPLTIKRHFWRFRRLMKARKDFGNFIEERGLRWYEHSMFFPERYRTPKGIAFADIATHNHFVYDLGGKVFNRTAPVIKLPIAADGDEYLGLLGLLNSSVACFWMKQVCFPKDGQGQMWEERFAFNATNIAEFPVASERPLVITQHIFTLTQELAASRPETILAKADAGSNLLPTRSSLDVAKARATLIFQQMVAWQEELDWQCYRLYGLMPSESNAQNFEHIAPPDVALGERAFEIVLARRVAAGTFETNWFERHGSTPITEIPTRWPDDFRQVVQQRINAIEREPNIKLIEQPLCKRRWNSTPWEELEQTALREWLLARLESTRYWTTNANQPPTLTSTSRLADQARDDADFMQVAAIYAGHADFEISQLVAQLVASEAVPMLPAQRYTDAGQRKRTQWEDTWALQRREDAGQNVGDIPVPPKYKNTDFVKVDFWRLRGGLDVPKERWISYPGCERGADGSLVIAWAGWDYLQQATAIASYYLDMKESEGWPPERLQPLLAGLLELVPWLEQWHNEVDPVYGERMGHYYKGFVAEEARSQGFTLDDLKAWKPVVVAATRGRRRATP